MAVNVVSFIDSDENLLVHAEKDYLRTFLYRVGSQLPRGTK